MAELPTGTVTFLLTDVEGSTALWQQAPEAMREALATHDALFDQIVRAHHGVDVKPRGEGDSHFAVFASAADALVAALALQRRLAGAPWPTPRPIRVRVALHTGEAELRDGDYYGSVVNRCARLRGISHGGQTLLSEATAALVRDALPDGVGLLDLGEHRLKDLTRPERVFQLVSPDLPGEFPPLRSLDVLPNNLPRQLTSFVGREREMAEANRMLGATPLLTIVGTGGAGKTRLALQVAGDLLEAYPDGVWLVELAALADPALVPQAVASALGLFEQPSRPLIQTLADFLKPRTLLLVLDNCEHLVEACAALADNLLRACPRLRILATSREALGIAGETAWRLPSLSLPDPRHLPPTDSLTQYEAVRLFIERALAAQPTFAVTNQNAPAVAQLCHRLDGIPLAIELAAARVKALPVEQIAARLDDRFRLLTGGSRTALPRQQTLRAAIDWSYALLSEPERVLLRRLSVFAGGWTLEAAEAVCAGDGLEDFEVLDPLSQLVDKSLVLADEQGGEARYRLLETVRQYAQDRLLETGEAEVVRDRHRDWFLELVEQAEPKLEGSEQAAWFERLEQEHDNLRAALAWSQADVRGLELGLRLAGGLWWPWILRGHLRETREQLVGLLAQSPTATLARAKALFGAAHAAFVQGDYDEARGLMEETLALSRRLGDKRGIAIALGQLGRVAHAQGDYPGAMTLLEESRTLFQELGGESGLKWPVASTLADVVRDQGEHDRARDLYEQGLAPARARGDRHAAGYALRGLGHLARVRGDFDQAEALFKESLALVWELKDHGCACLSIEGLSRVTGPQGRAERTARLFGAAETIRQLLGEQLLPAERAACERDLAAVRAELGEEAFAAAWAEGLAMSVEQAVAYALDESGST